MLNKNKIILFLLILLNFFSANFNFVHAATVNSICGNTDPASFTILNLVCVAVRITNFAFILVGGVFLIMFLLGMYKYATAWGDPKGIQGAKSSITSAVTGLLVSLGTFTIITITASVFGIEITQFSELNPFNNLITNICNFFTAAKVKNICN